MYQFSFPYERSLKSQLPAAAQDLLSAAEVVTKDSSLATDVTIRTGAALLLADRSLITSAGAENALFAACRCAARAVIDLYRTDGGQKVKAIAIVYKASEAAHPPSLTPCGSCRQSILDMQLRQATPVTVYISSPSDEVIMVEDALHLLPFHFNGL